VLKRRPSDALLLLMTVAMIAVVLLAVMVLQQVAVTHDATVGSMGALRPLQR
jgi:hypothetical protein